MIAKENLNTVAFVKTRAHLRELMNKLNPDRNYETADVVAFERLHEAELIEALNATLRRFIAAKLGVKQ